MKIVKSRKGINILYDTENTKKGELYMKDTRNLKPLHHAHNKSDYEFLQDHFSVIHPIFDDFSGSDYYAICEIAEPDNNPSKKIALPKGGSKHLQRIFRCSHVTVRRALNFETDTKQARKIRNYALENGGVMYHGNVTML